MRSQRTPSADWGTDALFAKLEDQAGFEPAVSLRCRLKRPARSAATVTGPRSIRRFIRANGGPGWLRSTGRRVKRPLPLHSGLRLQVRSYIARSGSDRVWFAGRPFTAVMRGLVPRIPLRDTLYPPKRDGRDKPGHDAARVERGPIGPSSRCRPWLSRLSGKCSAAELRKVGTSSGIRTPDPAV